MKRIKNLNYFRLWEEYLKDYYNTLDYLWTDYPEDFGSYYIDYSNTIKELYGYKTLREFLEYCVYDIFNRCCNLLEHEDTMDIEGDYNYLYNLFDTFRLFLKDRSIK